MNSRDVCKSVRFAACLCLAVVASVCHAQLPSGWQSYDIGSAPTGSDSYASGVFTLNGGGTGFAQTTDQYHFTYTTLASGGNFRITARIASFTGAAGSEVGVVVRPDDNGTSSSAGAVFKPATGSSPKPNLFEMFDRNNTTGSHLVWTSPSTSTSMTIPYWLEIVKSGNDLAVYKSSDGVSWSQIQDASGGAYTVGGTELVGFLVASGSSSLVTATIDNVTVNTSPALPYETSWIGNTYIPDSTNHVSADVNAMWVGSDGSCYTNGSYEEATQSAKIYKNGAVVNPITAASGNNESYEGSITSDGTYLYHWGWYTSTHYGIFRTDMTGANNMQPIYTVSPLLNSTSNVMLSGMAAGNGELYISDAQTGQVLVANPAQSMYGMPTNATTNVVTNTIDTSGVTSAAPQAVYQSQYENDLISLTIPGLTSGTNYTVRLHFAELEGAAAGTRQMNIGVGSQSATNYDIVTTAGATFKAAILAFTNVTSQTNGNLLITLRKGATNSSGHAVLNGIEILNPGGTTFLDLNCGGGDVASTSWQRTVQEEVGRDFSFTRPGPIVVDNRGNLWIIQEGTSFPASGNFTYTSGWAAIKCYNKYGVYQGQEITDVVNPTALGYDSVNDRLLVAENGPAQNIRIYTSLTTTPACTSTLGVNGGVFAGSTPGLVYDPSSGGYARFYGPTGVGCDSSGNIYVACNGEGFSQSTLTAWTSSGSLIWRIMALEFTNCGDFDPTINASDIWTPSKHYKMTYSGNTPGGEWSLYSYLWDPFTEGVQPRYVNTSAVFRRLGASNTPFIFTAGQGSLGPIYIYRFVGEQIVPCGRINTGTNGVWIDANGDGIEQSSEDQTITGISAILASFDVDNSGNVYLAMAGRSAANPNIDKLLFQGINSAGAPVYSVASGGYIDKPAPAPFNTVWGNNARVRYLGGTSDTILAEAETSPSASDLTYGGTVVRVDNFSTTPTVIWTTVLPTPLTESDFVNGIPPYSTGDGFLYKAMDAAGGYAFPIDLWGTIRVVDVNTGALVRTIVPGPEVDGGNAWEDEVMGIRAHYNAATNEYDIDTENSGWDGKLNFYRWSPFSMTDQDIGSPVEAGSASEASGVFTVNGSGVDITGTSDQFNYAYQQLDGNGSIVARVTGMTGAVNGWAKVGVMMRNDLTAGSANAFMLVSLGNGLSFQSRSTAGGSTANQNGGTGITPASKEWIKLTRSGSTFTAYCHADGATTWTQLGTPYTATMSNTIYVGLAVTAHDTNHMATATVDNVLALSQ